MLVLRPALTHGLEFNSFCYMTLMVATQPKKKCTSANYQEKNKRGRLNEPFSHHAGLSTLFDIPWGAQIINTINNSV